MRDTTTGLSGRVASIVSAGLDRLEAGRGGETAVRKGPRPLPIALAAALFGASLAWGWRHLPDLPPGHSWALIGLVGLVGILVGLVLNGIEFTLLSRLVDYAVPRWVAARTSVLGSVANILPIPGAALIRLQVLRRAGVATPRSVRAVAIVALLWISGSVVVSAGVQLGADTSAAVLLIVLSLGPLAAAVLLMRRGQRPAQPASLFVRVLLLESLFVPVAGVRFWLIGNALQLPLSMRDAISIGAAGTVATVAGVLPGGLGLREVLSGAFGAAVGVTASTGVLVSAVDRLAALAALAVVALGAAVIDRRVAILGLDSPSES